MEEGDVDMDSHRRRGRRGRGTSRKGQMKGTLRKGMSRKGDVDYGRRRRHGGRPWKRGDDE